MPRNSSKSVDKDDSLPKTFCSYTGFVWVGSTTTAEEFAMMLKE
jgi:hypothetical protein